MQKIMASSFSDAIKHTQQLFVNDEATKVRTERWQGMDISKRPEMVSYELLNYGLSVPLSGIALNHYRSDIKPNLPWADNHFEERVCGEPINPGVEWANWPWATSADKFRDKGERFNHNYMERYWCKFAGKVDDYAGYIHRGHGGPALFPTDQNVGIRNPYGDMMDMVDLLSKEPHTRQAWIPIFFPEDTGIGDGGRKPCTLGYQFIMRNQFLNVYYPLRSCDFVRHFRDDIYLTVRLLLWVLEWCKRQNPEAWDCVRPGVYDMHCTSLHIFENDRIKLRNGQ